MKKITHIVNSCLLVLMIVNGIAMLFFLNNVSETSIMIEIMSAVMLLLTAFLYYVLGIFYPEDREEATGKKEKILVFLEKLGGVRYMKYANGSRERYVGPRQCRRYWEPVIGAIMIVFYGFLGVFVFGMGESSAVFKTLWISGCVLIVLMMIVGVFWKYEDIREITGESHPWIAMESIFIVFGIFALCSLIGYIPYRIDRNKSPFRVDMDKIKQEVQQAENAEWDFDADRFDYMQMSEVLAQMKESYDDTSIYYKIANAGETTDSNGVACEKILFIVTGEKKEDVIVFEYYRYEGKGYVLYQSWKSDAMDRDTLIEKNDGVF